QNPLFPLPPPTNPSLKRAENPSAPALVATNGIAPFISSVSTPQRNHIFTARIDQKWTKLHDGAFLFQFGRLNNLRQFGGGDRLAEALVGKSTTGATDRKEDRFQGQEIFTYVRGAHSMKFGGDIQRIKSTFIDLSDASGAWDFDSAGDFLANIPSRFRQNFLTTSTQHNTYAGVFGQDEWRIRPNILLSYGLRYENENIVKDSNNFGPRLALAYDPFKSGKTVIRAGAGIFYNRALLRTIDDFTTGAQQS